jgi:TM2 domain-containing membrane protein YozV
MKLLNNTALTIAFFFLCSYNSFGQFDLDFVKHLSKNQFADEHLAYLESSALPVDSMAYFKAKYFIQYENDSLFFEQCESAQNLLTTDTLFLRYLDNYFLKKKDSNRAQWFSLRNAIIPKDTVGALVYYSLASNPSLTDTTLVPVMLRNDFKNYARAYKKKPIVALLLSTVLPGLGELYIGNLRASIAKFGSQTIFGLQIVESIYFVGLIHPLSFVNIGFFSAFYVANIVGSYRDTKTKKHDLKNQFLFHVSDYYASMYPASIY